MDSTTAATAEIVAACDRLYAEARAAEVPDDDRDGPGTEPVTVRGWYQVPTVSGRPAWALYVWRGGRCIEIKCTYDLDAERRSTAAAVSDPRLL